MIYDSDEATTFGQQLSEKMVQYYRVMHRTSEKELMAFNAEELQAIRYLYGTKMNYPIYMDIDQLLSHPEESEQVH